jgi:hypothetical protein
MAVKVRNSSKVQASFYWCFSEDEATAKAQAAIAKKPFIPINQVFDILPIRSFLQPGEIEEVEFTFYGHPNCKFKGLCVCELEGGPEYELTLIGEASTVGFRLDKSIIEFGKISHAVRETRDFYIINTGKVVFTYEIESNTPSHPGILDVSPSSGKVFHNDKQRIQVRVRPGLPRHFKECIVLRVAHFDPVSVLVYGEVCNNSYLQLVIFVSASPYPSSSGGLSGDFGVASPRRQFRPLPYFAPMGE